VTGGYLFFCNESAWNSPVEVQMNLGILLVVQSKHVSESTVLGLRGVFECCVHRTLRRTYDRYRFSEYAVVSRVCKFVHFQNRDETWD